MFGVLWGRSPPSSLFFVYWSDRFRSRIYWSLRSVHLSPALPLNKREQYEQCSAAIKHQSTDNRSPTFQTLRELSESRGTKLNLYFNWGDIHSSEICFFDCCEKMNSPSLISKIVFRLNRVENRLHDLIVWGNDYARNCANWITLRDNDFKEERFFRWIDIVTHSRSSMDRIQEFH